MFQEATQASAWREQGNRYGSNIGDPRVMESTTLKTVIIRTRKVTSESKIDFILI